MAILSTIARGASCIVHVLHIPTRRDFPSFQPWSTPLVASRPNQTANVERYEAM